MELFKILSFFCGCIWMPLAINILVDKDLGIKRRVICGILQSAVYSTTFFVDYSELATIWFFPICLLIVYFGMGKSKLQLLYVPTAYIIVVICNYIADVILKVFFHLTYLEIEDEPETKFGCMFLITLLVVIVSYLLKKVIAFYMRFFHGRISKKITLLLICNVILYTLVYLINGWTIRNMGFPEEIRDLNLIIFFAYTVLAIGILLLAFRVIQSQERMKQEDDERKNILEYAQQVESMYEGLRAFKHDYVNILAALSGYMDKEDMEGMKQYFQENILPTNEKINQENYHLQKLSRIQEPAIKGLISSKLIYAHSEGIDVFVDIVDDVTDIAMRPIDFTRILGIYLDNAIEAALESKKKEIKFNIVQDVHSITVVLMNSFLDHGITVGEMEKKHVSTKGEGRGLGLNNVQEILRQYSNIYKLSEIKEDYFVQTLIIEDKGKKKIVIVKSAVWFR